MSGRTPYIAMLLLACCLGAPAPARAAASVADRVPASPVRADAPSAPPSALQQAPAPASPAVPDAPNDGDDSDSDLLEAGPTSAMEDLELPDEPPPEFVGPLQPVVPFSQQVGDTVVFIGKSAEATHDRLERGILAQAIRLDSFFGTLNNPKEQNTSYQLRWRNELRLAQGGHFHFGSTLHAALSLSRVNERLRLYVSGENNPDPLSPSLPEDPGSPGFDRTFQNTRIVNTELRYQLFRSLVTDFFLGAGIDLTVPLDVFARARLQHVHRLSDTTQLAASETIFLKTPKSVGETTVVTMDHSLNPKTVLRLTTVGTVSQEIGALEWGSEVSLIRELSPRSAVTATGGVYGNTSLHNWIANYRVLALYRQKFLRDWLFYEVQPEFNWPRQTDGTFHSTFAVSVRLEVVFRGEEKKK